MRKRWWQYFLVLLTIALATSWIATLSDPKEFPYAFGYIVVVLLGIGAVIPLTGSFVAALHRRATRQPQTTTVTILGVLVGCFFTAPLVITLGFGAINAIRRHGF